MNRFIFALGLVALVGCGVDVEDVCEDLGDSCEVLASDCQRDGERVEQASEDLGCSEVFEAYLDCIDEASCAYESTCERERAELESCVELTPAD